MTCTSAKLDQFTCIDKIVIRAADTELLFLMKLKVTAKGDAKLKAHVDSIIWNKKYEVENKGSFALAQLSTKTILVSHSATGVSVTVSRRTGYFIFELQLTATFGVTGLCNGTIESLGEASSELSATHVRLSKFS